MTLKMLNDRQSTENTVAASADASKENADYAS